MGDLCFRLICQEIIRRGGWGTPVGNTCSHPRTRSCCKRAKTCARVHPTGLGRVASTEQPVSVGPEEKAALSKMRDRIQYKRQERE